MDDRMRQGSEALTHSLPSLAAELAFPPTPSLAPEITARLRSERSAGRRPPYPTAALWSRRRILVLVAVGLFAALAVAAAARYAIGAFEVRVQPGITPAPTLSPVAPGEIGEVAALEDAERQAGFAVALPEGPPPDEVYVIDTAYGDRGIVVAWQPGAPFPAIAGTKWSLLLMAFRGDAEIALKTVDRFQDVHETTVSALATCSVVLGRSPIPGSLQLITQSPEGA